VKDPERPKDWESWVNQQIREAQERGEFDDLPGTGKPLDLTPNPYALEQELAFKVLKDAGYAPEWIELDKAIRHWLESVRAVLQRQWEWREGRLRELAGRSDRWADDERRRAVVGWRDAVAAFELDFEAINKEIAELNLKVPSPRFQRSKLDAAREAARLEGEAS
jgi:DnaJ family protein C protein 28